MDHTGAANRSLRPVRKISRSKWRGFYLASFQVDDLEQSLLQLSQAGIGVPDAQPGSGLDDWQLVGLDPDDFCGIDLQLVKTGKS